MLDVSLPHLTHPRGQRETSEKRDNSESRNKSCQTVEFYYSNESYLTEINEPLRTFSCAHTLRKITSRGKREQPKKHLSQRLLLYLYFYNFKTVLESKTGGGWFWGMSFVSWPFLPCSAQTFAAYAPCRVPGTGGQCQVEMWPCDAGMSSFPRLSFQPSSSWLCH